MSKFIAIEGVIGVGKTTLARMLQTHFQATLLLEVFEENPFLARFYEDRERYAFQTQIFFLLSRYHQQHQAVPDALNKGNLISDYTFAKDEIFAWLNLRDDELAMYGRVHAALGEKLRRPDLIVYLRAEHETLMRRIALRDRPYERDMDPGYIRDVAAAYDAWLANAHEAPVLIIDVNNLDFLARPSDLQYILEKIQDRLNQQQPTTPAALAPLLPHATDTPAPHSQLPPPPCRPRAQCHRFSGRLSTIPPPTRRRQRVRCRSLLQLPAPGRRVRGTGYGHGPHLAPKPKTAPPG